MQYPTSKVGQLSTPTESLILGLQEVELFPTFSVYIVLRFQSASKKVSYSPRVYFSYL